MRFFFIFLSCFIVSFGGCFLPRIYNFTNDKEMWGGLTKGGKYSLERDVFITRKNNYWGMSPSFSMYNNVDIYPNSINVMDKIQQFDRRQYDYVGIIKKNTKIELTGLAGEYNYSVGHNLWLEAKILDGEYAGKVVKFDEMCRVTGGKEREFDLVKPDENYLKAVE